MKHPTIGSVILAMVLAPWCFAKEYRIDSQAKFDLLNTTALKPGDAILLKRSMQFTGMLAPQGNGVEGAPIRIDAFGEGKPPRIDAGGQHPAAVLLQNPSYWEVQGLEITNTNGKDEDQGALYGIRVVVTGPEGVYRHIYINQCNVHHVNGMVAGKNRGGIHVDVLKLQRTSLDDLRITNNRVENVGGVGISNSSSCGKVKIFPDREESRNLWTRVYVAGNTVDFTGRNNMIARASQDAIYEHNVLANSSRRDTGHSIFCFHTNGIKIQYNEAYGNVGDVSNKDGHGESDRGGFDADYNCVNTYIQYNYSHDNLWFCGIMKKPGRNYHIRYNISENDLSGIYFYGFDQSKNVENVFIYNNTHYIRKGLNVSVFPEGRTPWNTTFENNVFYFEEKGEWGAKAKGMNTLFRNNLYHNIMPHASETKAVVADPKLQMPGKAGKGIDLKTMARLRGYQPRAGSPCIDAAIPMKNHGGFDILKSPVNAKADLGAVEFVAPVNK